MPAAKASDPRPKKFWLLTLHPPASACRMVTCVNPCQCLTLLSDPLKKSRKMQMPAAKASDPRPKKCWLLTLHFRASACRMVTCFNPCQCLTLLSDPLKKSRKMQMPAAKASDPRPKKCWLLTLHPPASACRMVTCVNPCHFLTLLSDPLKKSRKMPMPAAKASDPRPKKCWLLTLHPPASACRMVTCVNPCQCNACGQSQRSKTQKMLASNASSPWQCVSNGYLSQPLPVPNVVF